MENPENVFLISLDPNSRLFDAGFSSECHAEGLLKLDDSMADRILYYKCTSFGNGDSALNYLMHVHKSFHNKQLVMNYVGLILNKETNEIFSFSEKYKLLPSNS